MTICVLCDAEALHRHHLTGRPASGEPYLDPHLTLDVCPVHHVGWHVGMRTVGIAWPSPVMVPLAFRLRRVAFHARHVASAEHSLTLRSPSAAALADLLDEAADKLDSFDPELLKGVPQHIAAGN